MIATFGTGARAVAESHGPLEPPIADGWMLRDQPLQPCRPDLVHDRHARRRRSLAHRRARHNATDPTLGDARARPASLAGRRRVRRAALRRLPENVEG